MKCPVCGCNLSPYSYGGQKIDVCPECHGIWFDRGEIAAVAKEMIRTKEVPDQDAKDAFPAASKPPGNDEVQKVCPKCRVPTDVVNYSYDSNVFVNKCPTCQGVWVDRGELERVALYIKGNPAVSRYTQALVEELARNAKQCLIFRLLKSRILSGIVALVYLGAAMATGDSEIIWKMTAFLVLPLACIWFSNEMGDYAGLVSLPRPAITRRTPGVFVAFAGWLVFLMPLLIGLVAVMKHDR